MVVKKVIIDKANRLHQLPPDIFSFAKNKLKPSLIKKTELIDLAHFQWPITMDESLLPNATGFKPTDVKRINQLKDLLIEWFDTYHKAKIKPNELFIGGRISSLIFKVALAFIDYGDIAFVPGLGHPLYKKIITAAGGEAVSYSITYKNRWQPRFDRMNTRLGKVARLLFLNSPHNPTGVVLNEKDWENLIWMASRENIMLINDAAYQSYREPTPPSLIGTNGGRKVGIEIYSFPYLLGLPYLPFGFAVGNKDIINGLKQASSLIPDYIPDYYIDMVLRAIHEYPNEALIKMRKNCRQAAGAANDLFALLDLEKSNYDTIPFLWAKIEKLRQATSLTNILYRRYRILTIPGSSFGDTGEEYLRFSLTAGSESFRKAYERIKNKPRLLKKRVNKQ
ncbi:MAG: pyridoxal phosphate-dependent aminotransferase [FCB group bacterium]|nr:pyridoxal phosphate-dependent aminotransferase [FCB group bacterium]